MAIKENNGGFYFSEEVGFEPDIKKPVKKDKGEKKDGKKKDSNKKTK